MYFGPKLFLNLIWTKMSQAQVMRTVNCVRYYVWRRSKKNGNWLSRGVEEWFSLERLETPDNVYFYQSGWIMSTCSYRISILRCMSSRHNGMPLHMTTCLLPTPFNLIPILMRKMNALINAGCEADCWNFKSIQSKNKKKQKNTTHHTPHTHIQ